MSKPAKKVDLACSKFNADKINIDKLKKVQTNLNNLKSQVDKLDVAKLVLVPFVLSKLSNIVKNDVIKKHVYNAKIKYIKDKIPDIANLVKTNDVNGEIPSITN